MMLMMITFNDNLYYYALEVGTDVGGKVNKQLADEYGHQNVFFLRPLLHLIARYGPPSELYDHVDHQHRHYLLFI